MPTYEYRCKFCNHEFDEWQTMSAVPLVECPKCRQPQLSRLMGAGGALVFKGSGFYLTDYKKKSSPEATENQTPSSAEKSSTSPSSAQSTGSSKASTQEGP